MKKILVVTGEESGDKQFSFLWEKLSPYFKDYGLWGVGGKYFNEIGGEVVFPKEKLSVMGISEVIKGLSTIYKAYKTIIGHEYVEQTKAVFLVDFPDFNFKIGKKMKEKGIPVFYFISPKIWAWRYGRVKTIKRITDLMLLIFPFEQEIYDREGVENVFVGNPIVYEMSNKINSVDIYKNSDLLFLPGSRMDEVTKLLPVMLKSARLLYHYGYKFEINIPVSNSINIETVKGIVNEYGKGLTVNIGKDSLYEFMKKSRIAVSASGTVNLELAVAGIPQIVIYKVSYLTYVIAKNFVNLDYASPVNIIYGNELVKELLQNDATETNITKEMLKLLENSLLTDKIREGYKKLISDLTENVDYEIVSERIKRKIK